MWPDVLQKKDLSTKTFFFYSGYGDSFHIFVFLYFLLHFHFTYFISIFILFRWFFSLQFHVLGCFIFLVSSTASQRSLWIRTRSVCKNYMASFPSKIISFCYWSKKFDWRSSIDYSVFVIHFLFFFHFFNHRHLKCWGQRKTIDLTEKNALKLVKGPSLTALS